MYCGPALGLARAKIEMQGQPWANPAPTRKEDTTSSLYAGSSLTGLMYENPAYLAACVRNEEMKIGGGVVSSFLHFII